MGAWLHTGSDRRRARRLRSSAGMCPPSSCTGFKRAEIVRIEPERTRPSLLGDHASVFNWLHVCALGTLVASFAQAKSTSTGTPPLLAAAGIAVALFAVIVALFKDEFWRWRHAPKLEAQLKRGGPDLSRIFLVLRNSSSRTVAQSASVRVAEVHPHPHVEAIGPKGVDPVVYVDKLLRRASGDDRFDIAPQGEVRLELATLKDGYGPDDPVVASVAWGGPGDNWGYLEDPEQLLVLPSWEARLEWGEQPTLGHFKPPLDSPAVIILELAASNVSAKLWSVSLWRDPAMPPADGLPMAATRYGGLPQADLSEGRDPASAVAARRSRSGEGMTMEEWRRQYEERKREQEQAKRKRRQVE
jgi:hypothetical protein